MTYRTIVIDPPWRYTIAQDLTNKHADKEHGRRVRPTAEGQYGTMTNEDIAALPVGDWADDQAHLYLWTTNPHLFGTGLRGASRGPTPVEMLQGWGFTYITLLTWHKLGAPGMGWYFRGDTEHVLFGVKGRLPIPSGIRESNHFAASRGEHSAKPDRFYELVERVSPGPYLEMFARRRRYGWDVWGNEAPEFAASQAEMGLTEGEPLDFPLNPPSLYRTRA